MHHNIAIVGAPTSLGIKPYNNGRVRHLDVAPSVYRGLGIVESLGASDHGDVVPPPYRDVVRDGIGTRNEDLIVSYSAGLADRVAHAGAGGEFVLLLGGDCSIVVGALAGVRQRAGRVGLAYLDSHADFAVPAESRTGSASSMCLGHAVGRDSAPLATLHGDGPLVLEEDTVIVGRSLDADEPEEAKAALTASRVLDVNRDVLRSRPPADSVSMILSRVAHPELDGFWIHLDADVIDPELVPSVDSPEPGGLSFHELDSILRPLATHPAALGMQVTIHDPGLDPDGRGARALTQALLRALT